MARTAEGVGFDSLWLGDHLLYDLPGGVTRGPWEAWTALAALAAATEHVELGPLVASTSFHAPAMLAKQAATVDAIAGGRLILGLGAGWNELGTGVRVPTTIGSRYEEAFTIIRSLLRGGRVDFDGAYYRVEDCVLDPGPARPGGPPLMLGSTRPRMMRIGLPHVDAWNVWWSEYGNTPDGFAAVRDRVDEAAVQAGRLPGEHHRHSRGWIRPARWNQALAGDVATVLSGRSGDRPLTSAVTSRRWRAPAPCTFNLLWTRSQWGLLRCSAKCSPR
jgi:alkanesulfonate monooxygenase SsuD/methylene tetrahydromethanopterin reductase-like flavin-dependent oxidoreductase (luciferase family)